MGNVWKRSQISKNIIVKIITFVNYFDGFLTFYLTFTLNVGGYRKLYSIFLLEHVDNLVISVKILVK
jgi:hypothetical protein